MSFKHDVVCSGCDVRGTLSWKMDENDRGWHCASCGERPGDPAGFSADLDKQLLGCKVSEIVSYMQESEMLRIAETSQRDDLISQVVERGDRTGYRDQSSLVTFVITFWKEVDVGDE